MDEIPSWCFAGKLFVTCGALPWTDTAVMTCWHNKSVLSSLLSLLQLKNTSWNHFMFVILLPGGVGGDPCPLCSPRVTLSCDKCEHKAMPTHAVPAMSTQREHQSWSKIAGLASSQVLTESCFHIPWKAFNKCHQIRRCSVVIRAGWHHQGDGHCLGWWPAGPAERHKLPDSGEERDPNQDLTPLYSIPSRSSSAGDP